LYKGGRDIWNVDRQHERSRILEMRKHGDYLCKVVNIPSAASNEYQAIVSGLQEFQPSRIPRCTALQDTETHIYMGQFRQYSQFLDNVMGLFGELFPDGSGFCNDPLRLTALESGPSPRNRRCRTLLDKLIPVVRLRPHSERLSVG
jgi:hypothetical protein